MSFPYRGSISSTAWTASHIACIISIAGVAIIGVLLYSEIRDLKSPADDAGWAVFELGFEHQRLQLAVERSYSLNEIRLRNDIYLSRVLVLRDAPMLAALRERMLQENLTKLFQSAQTTDRLVAALVSPESRDALLWQLRADAGMIRELMLEISLLNRRIDWETRTEQSQVLVRYLAMLGVLMLALLGLSVFVFRITRKLRQAGRDLAVQLATQDAILKSVDAAILVLGRRGRVLYANPHALSLLGTDAASGAQLTEGKSEGASVAGEVRSLLQEGREPGGGSSGMRKVRLKSEAGARHYVIRAFPTNGGPSVDPGDDPDEAAHIVAVTDVTVEEEAALRREEYDARLGDASRLLAFATISGGIVHEISQPLAAIRNYVYALKGSLSQRPASEEYRAVADHLGEEVERAIEVVRSVRRMGPQEPQETGICDIHETIAHSVRLVTLGCSPPPPIAITQGEGKALVAGSLPMVGQVIVNLLKNGLGASSDAGSAGVEVSVTLCGGFATIAVADFGAGVSADAAKTMFAPFSKSARGGMGLGLAICQRIATTLGGSLSWENRDSGGAIFSFTVPLAKEGSAP